MTRPSDQTAFLPPASGPQQPAYWQPPTGPAPATGGWGQPAGLWTGAPVPPAQEGLRSVPTGTLDTGGRRPNRLVLAVLLAVMTAAAAVLGVLYVVDSADAADSLATAQSTAASERGARQRAEDARDEAEDRAATAEGERDDAKAAADKLSACQQASKDLLVALNGDPNAPATNQAGADALRRMATNCQ